MKEFQYPFEEFEKHFDDISGSPDLQAGGWEGNVFRVFQYMQAQYADAAETRYKVMLFMQYVSEHIQEFDTGDFGVIGSEKAGALVGRHVFRAVHQFFATRPLASFGNGPNVEDVKALATTFRGVT